MAENLAEAEAAMDRIKAQHSVIKSAAQLAIKSASAERVAKLAIEISISKNSSVSHEELVLEVAQDTRLGPLKAKISRAYSRIRSRKRALKNKAAGSHKKRKQLDIVARTSQIEPI